MVPEMRSTYVCRGGAHSMALRRLPLLAVALWHLLWTAVTVAVVVDIGLNLSGFAGVVVQHRRLQGTSYQNDSYAKSDDDPDVAAFIPLIELGVLVLVLCLELTALGCYWSCYIKPSADMYIPAFAVGVPSDLQGSFKYGFCDCFGDVGTCCCFVWCTPCSMADYWYRSGWLHATFGNQQLSCQGWQFCTGVFGYVFLEHVAGCFKPCIFAALRGGLDMSGQGNGGKFGELTPFRHRFAIRHEGFSTFMTDCCAWCCCGPCAFVQEYRQVLELLKRGPLHPTIPATVIGQAVQVGMPPLAPLAVTGTVVPASVMSNRHDNNVALSTKE